MAFTDGEPVDAAKLGELETKVNNLSAQIPKIGVASTNVSVTNNQTVNQVQTVTVPQIQVGSSLAFDLKVGPNTKEVTFAEPFTKTPKIICSTRMDKTKQAWHPQVSVAYGSSATGFTAYVFMPTGTIPHRVYVDYIAVAY